MDMEDRLRRAESLEDFTKLCDRMPAPDVKIDYAALKAYSRALQKPRFINPWAEYLTPRGNHARDLQHDFYELAISTSVNGGYLYQEGGTVRKWEIDGSGAKALLAKMDEGRQNRLLPGLHITDPDRACAQALRLFKDAPFALRRAYLWRELATPGAVQGLTQAFHRAARACQGNGWHFGWAELRDIAAAAPQSFGEDPFLKKAALLPILFAGVAHHKAGAGKVVLDLPVPADYRVPQTLHNIGVLRFSEALAETLDHDFLLPESHSYVTQLRAKSVAACDRILKIRPDLPIHALDGELWLAGRLFDAPAESLDAKKRAMRQDLETIGSRSGFDRSGFMRKSPRAMCVSTLRF